MIFDSRRSLEKEGLQGISEGRLKTGFERNAKGWHVLNTVEFRGARHLVTSADSETQQLCRRPQGVSVNALSSFRAVPKLPS